MFRRPVLSVAFVSGYLVVYTILLFSGRAALQQISLIMLFFSPLLLARMVYTVIRYGHYSGRELEAGEEFGYGDRATASLGNF